MVQWLAVGAANRNYLEDDLGFHMIALSTDLEVLRRIIPASGSRASSCEPGVRLGVSLHCPYKMRARVSFVRSTSVAQHACFPGVVRTRALLLFATGTVFEDPSGWASAIFNENPGDGDRLVCRRLFSQTCSAREQQTELSTRLIRYPFRCRFRILRSR